jgi:hypothetical protein
MRPRPRSIVAAAGLAAALLPLVGCGPSGPALVPVSGALTLNGAPLGGATITFAPEPNNTEVTPGGALSEADGRYAARYNERTGLSPGKYRVLVTKSATKDGQPIPEQFKDDPTMALISGYMIESLPPAYGNANTTPLSIDLGADGGTFDFDVKDTAKAKGK